MKTIKEALKQLHARLTYRKGDLKKARSLHKHFRIRREQEEQKGQEAEEAGKKVAAARHARRADARERKELHWKARVKEDVAAIENLHERIEKRTADLAKWMKEHGVQQVSENKFEGGDPHDRLQAMILKAAANYRAGTQPGYYSQSGGARDYHHAVNHYAHSRIWDCSTFADGAYICCDLEAPSGPNTLTAGGWTGTQGEHGKKVPESQARPGDLVLYGPFPHHHVEVVLDPKEKTTIGHGSPPVDPGVFDLFGDGDYIVRTYV